jgi:hypothetical protein
MTEDPKSQRPKFISASGIGGGLGGLIGFGGSKLAGLNSFWPWMLLGVGCAFIGAVLAQKIASK